MGLIAFMDKSIPCKPNLVRNDCCHYFEIMRILFWGWLTCNDALRGHWSKASIDWLLNAKESKGKLLQIILAKGQSIKGMLNGFYLLEVLGRLDNSNPLRFLIGWICQYLKVNGVLKVGIRAYSKRGTSRDPRERPNVLVLPIWNSSTSSFFNDLPILENSFLEPGSPRLIGTLGFSNIWLVKHQPGTKASWIVIQTLGRIYY